MVSRKKKPKQENTSGQKAVADTSAPEQAEQTLAPTAEEIIEALSTELEELEDRRLRLVAEFDNFRKRTSRERAQQEVRAQAELVKPLLESLDDLSRVCELGSNDHDAAAILEGVRLVEVKLRRALEQFGLKEIEAVGQPFDPEFHEAMVTVSTDQPEENELVSQELAKGYLFKDSLLRPALVEVKMYRPAPAGGAGEVESES
ncbi:MAG: nucleotide exchange factor GrpE [Gemmatimonadota bacterium]|jgi:molecular chaperone GrpE